ncbi:MAG: DUF3391 domain-containing protein [Psychrobium sp.]|nr:DUF3391 domain-containing protein [Psychrobium sp.]
MTKTSARIKLTIARLRPGIFIEIPGGWNAHPFMFSQFRISSKRQIAMLRQANIHFVYAVPDRSTVVPLPAIQDLLPEYQQQAVGVGVDDDDADEEQQQLADLQHEKEQKIAEMQLYRRSLKKCEANYQIALSKVRALTSKMQSRPLLALQEAQEVIEGMVEALLEKDDLILHLVNDERDDMDSYQHAVSVSMISMMIAKTLGVSKETMAQLGIAGLLHDIGKLKIPSQFYTVSDISASKRKHVVERHAEYSVEFLNLSPNIDALVKRIVLEHHEYADGSGYPARKKLDQLEPLSLIVSLVNFYEGLCYPKDSTKAKSPARALSYIFKTQGHLFDKRHLSAFIKSMGIYPPGTLVKLDNGLVGIVISVHTSKLLLPNVMVYDSNIPREEAAIINLENENVAIEGTVSARYLPKKVVEYLNPRTRSNFYFE